jgi:hypothetical protein
LRFVRPLQLAADHIEHVLQTEGAPYLSPAHLPWWQLHMLDVYAAIAAALLVVGLLLGALMQCLGAAACRFSRSRARPPRVHDDVKAKAA